MGLRRLWEHSLAHLCSLQPGRSACLHTGEVAVTTCVRMSDPVGSTTVACSASWVSQMALWSACAVIPEHVCHACALCAPGPAEPGPAHLRLTCSCACYTCVWCTRRRGPRVCACVAPAVTPPQSSCRRAAPVSCFSVEQQGYPMITTARRPSRCVTVCRSSRAPWRRASPSLCGSGFLGLALLPVKQ